MDHTVPLDKHQGSDSKSAEKKPKYQWEKTEGLNPQLITQFFLIALVAFILEMSAFDS